MFYVNSLILCCENSFYLFRVEVLATLTSDVGRILSKLHQVNPNGEINLHTGIRIAHVCNFINIFKLLYNLINFSWP